jgi:hypothetical protein
MSITQKHGMGCAVACVAYILGKTYDEALELFDDKTKAWTTGFYCEEIVAALCKGGRKYDFKQNPDADDLNRNNIIVFRAKSKLYPEGHYVARKHAFWMNSWINYPVISPIESGFEDNPFDDAAWIIYPASLLDLYAVDPALYTSESLWS